jgi:hypothetical protein
MGAGGGEVFLETCFSHKHLLDAEIRHPLLTGAWRRFAIDRHPSGIAAHGQPLAVAHSLNQAKGIGDRGYSVFARHAFFSCVLSRKKVYNATDPVHRTRIEESRDDDF